MKTLNCRRAVVAEGALHWFCRMPLIESGQGQVGEGPEWSWSQNQVHCWGGTIKRGKPERDWGRMRGVSKGREKFSRSILPPRGVHTEALQQMICPHINTQSCVLCVWQAIIWLYCKCAPQHLWVCHWPSYFISLQACNFSGRSGHSFPCSWRKLVSQHSRMDSVLVSLCPWSQTWSCSTNQQWQQFPYVAKRVIL